MKPGTPASPTESCESLYDNLFDGFVNAQFVTGSAETVFEHALAPSEDLFLKVYDDMRSSGVPDMPENVWRDLTREALENADVIVQATTIVFTHAAMDGYTYKCLRAVACAAPEVWRERLTSPDRALRNSLLSADQYAYRRALKEELVKIEQEPLPKKLDCLIELGNPPSRWLERPEIEYDYRTLLQRANRIRNVIVHRGEWLKNIEEWDLARSILTRAGSLAWQIMDYRFADRLRAVKATALWDEDEV